MIYSAQNMEQGKKREVLCCVERGIEAVKCNWVMGNLSQISHRHSD